MNSFVMYASLGLRKLLVRPLRNVYLRGLAVAALKKVPQLGIGIVVKGRFHIGEPTKVSIGDNVYFGDGFTVLGSGAFTVGSHTVFAQEVRVITDNHRFRNPSELPFEPGLEARAVTIGDRVWVGDRVTVAPGTTIGDDVIVASGSVVSGSIARAEIIGGNPARPIRRRDVEHLDAVVAAQRFYKWPKKHDTIVGRNSAFLGTSRETEAAEGTSD